jgi:diguanylate cyclase (GGDEF)-like protein
MISSRALSEKQAIVVNDSRHDSRFYGTERAAYRVRSIVALPMILSGEAVAVLTLYSEDAHFFNEGEMTLLTALVQDLGFAIGHISREERLNYLAYYDELTGLANRNLFLERVGQYLRGEVSGRSKIAVMLIDLDRFKNVNDSLGRPTGDALLKQVAEWLARNRGDANLVARLGADHFAVVLPNVAPGRELERLLEDMLRALLAHPFSLQGAELRVSITVGVALFPKDGADAETLFRNAEAALKKAKARGKRYLFYATVMTNAVEGKLSLETQLREALEKDQFVLYYQPKISLATGLLTGAEALLRWNDPRIGRWVLGAARKDHARWRAEGLFTGRVAVNVSPIQLRDGDFIAELERTVGLDANAAAGLELEITESVIMEDINHSIASLRAIRAMGLTIAIDDFGTGFSSLSYLAKLPADTLKIDRSFILNMTQGPEGLAIVSTIISLAHGLKLKVVAEGVETEEQSRLLRLLGCDEMQGFFFSGPIPREAFESKYVTMLTSLSSDKR